MEGIERVDGELYENWTGRSWLGDGQGFPHRGNDLPHSPNGGAELTQRLEERHLVDVLQRPPALHHKHSDEEEVRYVWQQQNALLTTSALLS